jgi:hypothetical protein
MAGAFMKQPRVTYVTFGIATSYIADIHWNCSFILSVISLCAHHSCRNRGTAQENCGDLVTCQAGG